MKHLKKLLSVSLAALLVVGTAATAQAKGYDVNDGRIEIFADGTDQIVYTEAAPGEPYTEHKDTSPVLTGTTKENNVIVDVFNGDTLTLTLDNLTMLSPGSTLDLYPTEGKIELILKGHNELAGSSRYGWDGLYIAAFTDSDNSVSISGSGSLTSSVSATADSPAVYVFGTDLSVDGGSLTASSPAGCGIGLYGGSTLSVSEDYLHPASVTVKGGEGSFDMDDDSQVLIGDNNFVFDEKGRDITAQVLANPDLLKTLKYVIISTRDIAVFPSGNMESNVHMMTAYKNTKFEQTGEPSAEAMKLLSEGMQGEALYAGSFAFTDEIQDHGKFQVNIMLPQYAGKHVTLVTLDGGKAVAYDRWVGNDGLVWAHVNHLGDFAVFAA